MIGVPRQLFSTELSTISVDYFEELHSSQLVDDLLTCRRAANVLRIETQIAVGINQTSSMYFFGGIRLISPLSIFLGLSEAGRAWATSRRMTRALSSRAQPSTMNLRRGLAVAFVLLTLVGCVQTERGQGQAPYAPYSPDPNGEYPRDRGGDGSVGGGGAM